MKIATHFPPRDETECRRRTRAAWRHWNRYRTDRERFVDYAALLFVLVLIIIARVLTVKGGIL